MRRKGSILAAFAALMVLGFSISPAMAYFTCYTEAEGVKVVKFSNDTTIDEPEVKDWVKHLVITNTGDGAVFIRAKAYAPSKYPCTYSGTNWDLTQDSEGFVYYKLPVAAGAKAEELLVNIDANLPEDTMYGEAFNVAVVYEAVPVRYNEDGSLKAYNDLTDVWVQPFTVIDK